MPSTDRPDPQNSSMSHLGGPDLVIVDCDVSWSTPSAAVAAGTAYGYVGGLVDPAGLAAAGAVLFNDLAGLLLP